MNAAATFISPLRNAATAATKAFHTAQFIRVWANAVRQPERLDDIIEMADRLATEEDADTVLRRIYADPGAKRGLESRVRTGPIDIPQLAAMTEGTLGRAFADFLMAHNLDPNDLPHRNHETDYDWLQAQLFETHDIWHVVTGFKPDIAGEMGLQAFYLAQLDLPLAMAILAGGFMNALFKDRQDAGPRMQAVTRGWQMGQRSKLLIGADWRSMWNQPLDEIRSTFGIH